MSDYVGWLNKVPGKPVFVAYPAGFDWTFVYWYLISYTGQSPFGFSALDIKSFAMALMGKKYRESVKKHMPRRWFSAAKHTHVALEDAREQGQMFISMLKEARARPDERWKI
jgi:DNA polymerase III alpha subunit (gram-positive type)